MQQHRTVSSTLVAGLLALGLAPAAHAADTDADSEAASASEEPAPISDQQLEQFTLALTDIREIRMKYIPRLKAATSQEERQQLKQAGQQEMVEAIRDKGLGIQEYNRIGSRLGNEKELRQRMKAMLEQNSS